MFGWTARLLAAVAITLGAAGSVKAQPQDRQMGGIGITVFDDIGYRGPNATFRNDQPDLGPAGFSNRISSLQVARKESAFRSQHSGVRIQNTNLHWRRPEPAP